jgi:hypothetical protein
MNCPSEPLWTPDHAVQGSRVPQPAQMLLTYVCVASAGVSGAWGPVPC